VTDTSRIAEIVEGQMGLEGPMLPILHALQAEYGFVPEDAVPVIAERLNIGRAEVHGVITFYHDFRAQRAGKRVVKLCQSESCKSVGADALAAHAKARLGIDFHETTAEGAVTLEPVYCLGLCACGPAALVDGEVVGRLDAAKLDAILKGAK
jgi:formate dehydrogenase subunit gamma